MKNLDEKTIVILAVAAIFLLLFLLQSNRIHTGEVIEKKFQKAHSSVEMTPSAGGAMRPQLVHHDDEWLVIIKNDTKMGRCWISETQWNKIELSDWINCRDLNNK